jgi:hypothetical protein
MPFTPQGNEKMLPHHLDLFDPCLLFLMSGYFGCGIWDKRTAAV